MKPQKNGTTPYPNQQEGSVNMMDQRKQQSQQQNPVKKK